MQSMSPLALSSKFFIFILMMVVFSEGASSFNRTVRLYSVCANSFMSVNANGRIVTSDAEDGFENLILISWDFQSLSIYAPLSNKYVCFNANWKLVGSGNLTTDGRCKFIEIPDSDDKMYIRFHSIVDKERFIGFTKRGKQFRKSRRINGSNGCSRFTKLDPSFNPKIHNDYLSGRVNTLSPQPINHHNYSLTDIIYNNNVLNNVNININNNNNYKNINNINKEYNFNNNNHGVKINGGKRKERRNRRIRHQRQHKKKRFPTTPAVGRLP